MDMVNVANLPPQELDALIKKVTEVYSWIARDDRRVAVSNLVPLIGEANLRDLLAERGYGRYPCAKCGDFFITCGGDDETVCKACEDPRSKDAHVSFDDYKKAFYELFRSKTSKASDEMWETLVDFLAAADTENVVKSAVVDCAMSWGKS